jgi:hypothetical protein
LFTHVPLYMSRCFKQVFSGVRVAQSLIYCVVFL